MMIMINKYTEKLTRDDGKLCVLIFMKAENKHARQRNGSLETINGKINFLDSSNVKSRSIKASQR